MNKYGPHAGKKAEKAMKERKGAKEMSMQKITPNLWFNGNAQEAVDYIATHLTLVDLTLGNSCCLCYNNFTRPSCQEFAHFGTTR
jgi:hypothetical protein